MGLLLVDVPLTSIRNRTTNLSNQLLSHLGQSSLLGEFPDINSEGLILDVSPPCASIADRDCSHGEKSGLISV